MRLSRSLLLTMVSSSSNNSQQQKQQQPTQNDPSTDIRKTGSYPSAVYSNKLSNIGNLPPKRYAPPPPPPNRAFHHTSQDEEGGATLGGNNFESIYLLEDQQQQQQQQQETLMSRQMDHALLQERHMESQTITNQMRQILEINRDLSFLVSQQQESIDIIEENALETHDNAERGKSYLEQANRIMRRTMRGEGFMRVFFWVLAMGGLLIALVLFLEAL
jgi:t-SNARE complex subunit, syntaxin